ncbi:DUF475 domain-containing protein [Nocardioides insulae]|uniref:DUF475 domain-containing protein n=1 Tax=Nocardioides insulae TaxID=394734 RepID=UPI000404780D|nr:DUF475 domain-containing protein [Nocardioides insulae]
MILRTFGWSFGITAAALIGALILGGPTAFVLVAVLSILEISLSFDNAVINAKILDRMSEFWQKMFLTVGILIAVFGMRLVFPLLLVALTAHLGPVETLDLAINDPDTYSHHLEEAHPAIASFGGMFLFLLFLDFVFEDREHTWLSWIERPLARIGALDQLSVVVALGTLIAAAEFLASDPGTVMIAGGLGIVTYLLVNGLGNLFEQSGLAQAGIDEEEGAGGVVATGGPSSAVKATGKAAFFLFLYLEVLDASFSFDGVVGAFAITSDIFIIMVGLGVGAMYIRSITVYLVRRGTLNEYVYLEHGAHWAIGALAVIMLITINPDLHISEIVTGLIGVVFIGAAVTSSVIRNRRIPEEQREKLHA